MPSRAKLLAVVLLASGVLAAATLREGERNGAPVAAPPVTAVAGAPLDLGGTPVAVAADAGGVWVVDATRGSLVRFDPATKRRVGNPVPVAGGPFAVAVGSGAVWVVAGDGSVRSYDPHRPATARTTTTVAGASGLAVGEGGVWVTSRRAGTLTRIDPSTGTAGAPVRVGGGPAEVAVGEGAVWIGDADGGTVTRVDPETARPTHVIEAGSGNVRAIAVGAGAVWVARAEGRFRDRIELVRIDPSENRLAGEPRPVPGGVPLDLTIGAGSVWATDVGGLAGTPGGERRGAITQVGRTSQRIAVEGHPAAIAYSEDGLWVVSTTDGTLTHVALGRA